MHASPLRPARSLAREARSLSVLTEGRFELGVGTGRPGIQDELRELGLPAVTAGERLSRVRDAVTLLRELDGPALRTPVVMAVAGPKARALAADLAGTVTFAAPPGTDPAALRRRTRCRHCPVTRRRPPRKSCGGGRRAVSPTSPPAPAPPARSPRSSPSWPGTEPAGGPLPRR